MYTPPTVAMPRDFVSHRKGKFHSLQNRSNSLWQTRGAQSRGNGNSNPGRADPELGSCLMSLSGSSEQSVWVCFPPSCLCTLPPATELNVNPTRVASVHRFSGVSYRPLCSFGGRAGASLRKQRDNCKESLLIIKKKKGFETWRMHKSTRLFENTSSDSPKGELHYIPHAAAKPPRLDTTTPPHPRDGCLTWPETDVSVLTHCWCFLGPNGIGMVLAIALSAPVFTCVTCFMLACFLLLFFSFLCSSGCLRRQGKRIVLHGHV